MAFIQLIFDNAEPIRVERVVVHEALNALFEVRLWLTHQDNALDIEAWVGRAATLRLSTAQVWTGICCDAAQTHAGRDARAKNPEPSHYELRLVPNLWQLSMRRSRRIFQCQTVMQVITAVLDDWQIERQWRIDAARYPELDYCVQYGQTDLDFVQQLLQDAGISYFFETADGDKTIVVFSDSIGTIDATQDRIIGNVNSSGRAMDAAHISHIALAKHRPKEPLTSSEDNTSVTFTCARTDLAPGMHFNMTQAHPALPADANWLVTDLLSEGQEGGRWSCSGSATRAGQPLRPRLTTPPQLIHGPVAATVVGPPGEEIHTDELGRVRVRFAWDRHSSIPQGAAPQGAAPQGSGRKQNAAGRTSCWLRVNQGWAGNGHGMLALPRVGQQVLVGFVNGDPNQPVVLGQLTDNRQLNDAKGREQLSIRAHRNLRNLVKRDQCSTVGHNRNIMVNHCSTVTVEQQLHEQVGGDRIELSSKGHLESIGEDRFKQVQGDEVTRNGKSQRHTVMGALEQQVGGQRRRQLDMRADSVHRGGHMQQIDGTRSIIVEGNAHHSIGRRHALSAGGDIHLKSARKLIAEATDVTFKAGGCFVRIDASGVTVRGPLVLINSGGEPSQGRGAAPRLPKKPGVGVLDPPSEELNAIRLAAFRRGILLPAVRSWPPAGEVEPLLSAAVPKAAAATSNAADISAPENGDSTRDPPSGK